ncbi:hypothetical protein PS662_04164 [Pseudomonas fluorescens]|uniref:DUF946 domain-containing protein n=1 Tax=Pseudomonas fluorescens TaxID=294 RepID=A0A5E6VHT4_PSEFL|nr:Vps62-related protein [Pseudomonas fluorescens]VVN17203.1 hypothetical protein PS662_04164 [Pseudomonas fluorescens]
MTTNDIGALPTRQMESIKLDNLLINFTTEFNRVLDTRNLRTSAAGFWRPTPAPDVLQGYFPLGDVAISSNSNINGFVAAAVVCESALPSVDSTKGNALSPPSDFERVWSDAGSGATTTRSIWRAIPPAGYVALGMVCSGDDVKPSFNAVRCVRADLVIAANVGDLIWNDRRSNATKNVSAWNIDPPTAAAGEMYLAPGTFFGVENHSKPETALVYALRMQIPLQVTAAPEPPALSGYDAPPAVEAWQVTQIAKLPWFAVKDSIDPIDQLRTSPYYRLERTDKWKLVGYDRNTSDKARPFKCSAMRAQNPTTAHEFNRFTSIEFEGAWPIDFPRRAFNFSANLTKRFTHTEKSAAGWLKSWPQEVIAMAAKNKAVAIYQMESTYQLLREDGTPVTSSIQYTDDESLHLSEYPPEVNCAVTVAPPPTAHSPLSENASETVSDVTVIPQPMEELPVATDTAP